jgi:ATP-dependent DNA helicase PIF1
MTQDDALAILKTGASVFLTGEPGSGKSFTVNAYAAWLRETGIPSAITASTGIAATHIGGRTVHGWSGVGVRERLTADDLDRIAASRTTVNRIRAAEVLVIDEISMLPAHVLTMLDEIARSVRRADAPFGGLQMVFVGDFFQLPPVRRRRDDFNQDEETSDFAFDSPAWRDLDPAVCYLTEQHRQADGPFHAILDSIRRGTFGEEERARLAERRIAWEHAPADMTRLFPHNRSVDAINAEELTKLKGEKRVFDMRHTGPEQIVATLKSGCLSPERLELKKKAVVMFTKNDAQGRYVNGTLGVVNGFDEDTGRPIVQTRSGRALTVEPAEWAAGDPASADATIAQIPLRLAWAITVHKSQGMSLDAAVIDLSGAFEYGHGYVALSRVRSLEGLHLLGWNERALRVHPQAAEMDSAFRARSERAEEILSALGPEKIGARRDAFVARAARSEDRPRARGAKPSGAGRPWTTALDEELRRRHLGGERPSAIAKAMDRTRGAIASRLKRLGLES